MRRATLLLLPLLAALTPLLAAPKPPGTGLTGPPGATTLVVRGAMLVDGTGKAPLKNACVVAVNGRITQVGPAALVRVPAGARVLTAPAGSTLLPGFIDMHVHSTVQPGMMPYFLANGITSVRDLGCADTKVEELKQYRADAPSGKQVGPRMFMAGPPLDGFPRAASWFPGPGARDAAGAVEAVDRLADQGVDVIKLYRRLNAVSSKAAIEEAHRRGLPVTWDYQWSYRYAANAALSGTDGLEHVFYSERASRDENQQLAETIAASKLWFEPTLVAFRPPDSAVTQDPDFARLPASLTTFWHRLFWPMETDAEFATMQAFVRSVHRQGGRILVGTDSPVKYVAPGYGFHREMQLLTECGLTPMEVLQAGTRSAAQSLRRERDLGTVEPGKLADLVIVAGDPLKQITATRNVRWVVQNGRVYQPEALVALGRKEAPAAGPALPPYVHGD
jgi:imidazolonepropionase-like amidohydrolase